MFIVYLMTKSNKIEKIIFCVICPLTDDQLQTGINLIESFEDIFVKDDINIGNTHVKHRIDLNDDRPFKQRYRRIPPAMFDEVKEHIRQLLTAGTIRPSHSPWA